MEVSLGPDWMRYFDLCIYNAKKPLFHISDDSCFIEDGRRLGSLKELRESECKMLEQGNGNILTEYF